MTIGSMLEVINGPWEVRDQETRLQILGPCDATGFPVHIAEVARHRDKVMDWERDWARLMAAAPKLLRVSRNLLSLVEAMDLVMSVAPGRFYKGESWNKTMAEAHAVIAEAMGAK